MKRSVETIRNHVIRNDGKEQKEEEEAAVEKSACGA